MKSLRYRFNSITFSKKKFIGLILPCLFSFYLLTLGLTGISAEAIASPMVANSEIKSNAKDLIYQGSNATETSDPDIGVKPEVLKAESIPAKPQKFVNPRDFSNKILEKIWQQFVDASAFLDKDRSSSSD
ncbi:MAG: hypothetical protein AAGF26_02875 [Cyanobacteria bacterium P01_G01_bin.49]